MTYCSCSVSLCLVGIIVAVAAAFKIWTTLTTGWARTKVCLVGKTVIVTGDNTGIGYETALNFAMRGAKVILACRNRTKAETARDKIVQETGNEKVFVKIIDMSSFQSVRAFSEEINKTEERLDILVNNAGAEGIGDERSEDGHVALMQANYLSSYLLTHLLIDLLKKSAPSRIVNVSSMAAKYAKTFKVEELDAYPGRVYKVYFNSKLCNILFTRELAKRLQGTGVTAYSLHPGVVRTEIFRNRRGIQNYIIHTILFPHFKTSNEEGAQTTVYTALEKGIEHLTGEHFHECRKVEPYKTVKVPGTTSKLWEKTETVIKMKPEEIRI